VCDVEKSETINFAKLLYFFSESDFNLDCKDDRGRTLFHNAVLRGESTIVKLLVEEGADPNILDKDKFSPLGLALREENYKAAYKLLKHPLQDVSIGAGMFCSLVHLAVAKLQPNLV